MTASQPSESLILTTDQLRAIEAQCQDLPLMQRAGRAAAEHARRLLALAHATNPCCVVLCGPGNNGGDGLVTAAHLRDLGIETFLVAPVTDRYTGAAKRALADWKDGGGRIFAQPEQRTPTLIIDALFGIGLTHAPTPPFSTLIEWANAQAGTPILALDIASGLASDSGFAFDPVIHASETIHFIGYKPGALTGDGPDVSGISKLATLDVPENALPTNAATLLDRHTLVLPPILQRTHRNVHKGSFGTLALLGGSTGMIGALIIAARAATRFGVGKTWLGFVSSPPDAAPKYDPLCPELMLRDAGMLVESEPDAWVVGCGLGLSKDAEQLLDRVLGCPVPLLLDADALNLLARISDGSKRLTQRQAPTVLTPHPAEAARLLHSDTAAIQRDRIGSALALAHNYNAHVVLKGQGSIIAAPDGTWAINATGNAALSFGGSGDALSGMIGALLAQGIDAATVLRFAVCLHGAAGDALAMKELPFGLTTDGLIREARAIMKTLLRPYPPGR